MGVVFSCRRRARLCAFQSGQEDIPVRSVMSSSKKESTASNISIRSDPSNNINTSEASTSAPGKALKFAEQVLCVHDSIQASTTLPSSYKRKISTGAIDDMVCMAEKMLAAQERFKTSNKPTHVDIGYHYTYTEYIGRIKTDGLLTRSERETKNNHTRFNGDSVGDGVYTGNNPFAFPYGDVGILVARLRGRVGTRTNQRSVDTAVGGPGTFSEMVVPGSSCQCVALVFFSSALIPERETTPGSDLIHKYHCQLQAVVDEIFNGGKTTEVPKALPEDEYTIQRIRFVLNPNQMRGAFAQGSTANSVLTSAMALQSTITVPLPSESQYGLHGRPTQMPGRPLSNSTATPTILSQANHATAPYLPPVDGAVGPPASTVPSKPPRSLVSEIVLYTAPHTFPCSNVSMFADLVSPLSECSICLDGSCASQGALSLTVCGHEFHKACIDTSLQYSMKCPVCRKWVGSKPQGSMPRGTMKVRQDPTASCSGYYPGAIIIDYLLAAGIQKVYHPNPGTPYGSTFRRAFLPDNADGRNLLKRLKYAFRHGLTFRVGTSLTTGVSNVITWSSIHHKTSLARGPHGFPDLGYFINSNEELDAIGVPASDNL
jgi:deltex-like protein